jgi:NAD(P)-dependent dehydrogenase (short-subunit alcohol dehydrogenase family)
MTVNFEGRVAIVTGAGNGLGRSHAIELAARGAKVVVNDLGGDRTGEGTSSAAAEDVVALIKAAGGDAFAHGANVADFDQVQDMVNQAMAKWGRVDILINNAGILRDKSFAKMALSDFKLVLDVHLMGSVNCIKAVWNIMKEQDYGRIVNTTSSSGLYGNFGQSNYGAAKLAVVGLMNTLVLESAKNNIRINCLAPTAATRMTEDLMPEDFLKMLTPESVTAGAMVLCDEHVAPNGNILCAGAGGYASATVYETDGIFLSADEQSADAVAAQWDAITDTANQVAPESGSFQTQKFLTKAMAAVEDHK